MSSVPTDRNAFRLLPYVLGAGLLASVAMALLLHWRLLPTGVWGQWVWPLREADFRCGPQWTIAAVLYGLMVAILLRVLRRPQITRGDIVAVVMMCSLAVAGTMLVLESNETLPPLHLASSTASVPATGYFAYATAMDGVGPLFRGLSGSQAEAQAMPARVLTHPPGPVLFYYFGIHALNQVPELAYGLEQYLEDRYSLTPELMHAFSRGYLMGTVTPAHLVQALILGLILTLLGSLLPIPAYFAGAAMGGARQGLVAACCATLLPSLLIIIPSIDGFGAVLALGTVAAWLWALRRQSLWVFAVSGLLMLLAVFWSIGLGAVAACMAVAAIPWLRRPDSRHRTLQGAGLAAALFILIHGLLYVLAGYSLPGNVRLMMGIQRLQMEGLHRDYLTWLPMNLYDVLLFMGPLLTGLGALVVAGARRLPELDRYYAWGAAAVLGLIWISGSTLGEVGRIWLFLMALLAVVPSSLLSRLDDRTAGRAVALLVAAQVLAAVALHCSLTLVKA